MQAKYLNVPYHPQLDEGYCLPACVQMVLDYYGVTIDQKRLAYILRMCAPLGVPASNIMRLRSETISVTLETATLSALQQHLDAGYPVITFVQANELPHWRGHVSQHAIVVTGLDEDNVYIRDPAAGSQTMTIPQADFMLAWGELDYLCALITPRK